MTPVLLGLGANIGDRRQTIRAALDGLAPFARISAVSALYETAPMYVTDQESFINICAVVETDLAPRELLHAVKALERALGRMPSRRFGPRQIDIDIIMYGDAEIAEDDLQIPHPRVLERAFVLVPAVDVAADWIHPVAGRTIRGLAADLGESPDVVCVGDAASLLTVPV
ncbi:2-amino-4-hydroxy-6-hydroxymethyldihydropteridine diphosphokinase [Fodinicurvata sp. EGI_FJ10296]|uniref:2-amino-4-hydroxy-6- hydroxymethyldihydropteridine diphosphokinase n=1 Tax=Fodinicurvata sp. EGI_FJ10296 TaxID=3231908 RepID=UPI003457396B